MFVSSVDGFTVEVPQCTALHEQGNEVPDPVLFEFSIGLVDNIGHTFAR